jgi:hypothetical protein
MFRLLPAGAVCRFSLTIQKHPETIETKQAVAIIQSGQTGLLSTIQPAIEPIGSLDKTIHTTRRSPMQ